MSSDEPQSFKQIFTEEARQTQPHGYALASLLDEPPYCNDQILLSAFAAALMEVVAQQTQLIARAHAANEAFDRIAVRAKTSMLEADRVLASLDL